MGFLDMFKSKPELFSDIVKEIRLAVAKGEDPTPHINHLKGQIEIAAEKCARNSKHFSGFASSHLNDFKKRSPVASNKSAFLEEKLSVIKHEFDAFMDNFQSDWQRVWER